MASQPRDVAARGRASGDTGTGSHAARDPVAAYFSRRAAGYQSESTRFPWSWIRARECAAVRALLGDVAGQDVLELGSGSGFYTRELLRAGARHVWAVDVSAAMLGGLPCGPVTRVEGDAASVTLGRRFPALLSAGMLEFVPDPAAVLSNAAHHAESGARFVLLVPRNSMLGRAYRAFHAAHGLRIRLFDRIELETVAARSGWEVSAVLPAPAFSLVMRLVRVK